MNADQAKAAAALVGQQLQNEWMTTYKVLSAIPEGKKDYKPEQNSRCAIDLAGHLASADVWFLNGVLNGKFDNPTDGEPKFNSVAEVGDWYKQHFPQVLERVLALDGNKLSQPIDFFGMKMPGVQYLLFALVHMVHHRGQLSTYLRPMGGKVPSIYGGSFDEPWQGPAEPSA
ncbi:MAG TPA: DinB family protein [Vicinamibacterales bacterium]|nr:DinB family protein [Vicinamibacterales bacterium]